MAYVLLAYLLGSLVGGLLFFPEVRAKDLPGGSGVFRRKGPWAALWVVLWDLGKGALALLLVPSEWRVWAGPFFPYLPCRRIPGGETSVVALIIQNKHIISNLMLTHL
nr:hypothetical protein [Thermus scotoductus]